MDKINNQKGITLIELLVALSILLLVLGGITKIFIIHFKSQRIILAEEFLLDQANYTMEYISRALRMAKKELNCTDPKNIESCYKEEPYCLTEEGFGHNYEVTRNGKGIKFLNPMRDYACQEFYWDKADSMLKERIIKPSPVEGKPLLSKRVEVESLSFTVTGNSQDDEFQPKVTINMKLKIPEENLEIDLRNTISQRDLDRSESRY